jgi:cytochrome c biogenesis protein
MRSAVLLLSIVAGLSIIATLLPQRALQPVRVSGYMQNHLTLGPLFDRLGLFAVFESWPLIVAATLMYVSLSVCVWTRSRAMYKRWRKGLPRNPQFIGEAGSLLFHASFFVLLGGVLFGKAAGFTAFVNVIEGQSVVEARASYDQMEEGLLVSADQHQGFEVKVDRFNVAYYGDGRPRDFVSHVEVFDGGQKVDERDVRVNEYLEHNGVKFYQANYGWAPVVQVTAPDGRRVFDGPIVFFGDPARADGVMKIPAAGPPPNQLGARMFFVPDLEQDSRGLHAGSADLKNPALDFLFFKGDLHAGRVQNVYDIDVTSMKQLGTMILGVGQTQTLPNGYTVAFPRVLRYTGLQVTDDPGVPIIWVAFGLGFLGLLVRLYLRPLLEEISRRRQHAASLAAEDGRAFASR